MTAGEYTVTASAYGYETETATVTVAVGDDLTQDFALDAADMVTVSGTVKDGSGHDWPLYAKVSIEGAAPDTYTDPSTGQFSMSLPAGTTYSVHVEAEYPGYVAQTREVTVGDGDARRGLRTRGRQHHLHGSGLRVQLQRRDHRRIQR